MPGLVRVDTGEMPDRDTGEMDADPPPADTGGMQDRDTGETPVKDTGESGEDWMTKARELLHTGEKDTGEKDTGEKRRGRPKRGTLYTIEFFPARDKKSGAKTDRYYWTYTEWSNGRRKRISPTAVHGKIEGITRVENCPDESRVAAYAAKHPDLSARLMRLPASVPR